MAAAIQHAAGGALLGAASSPQAADFTWRAVAAAAPRLLRHVQQRHACASAPRALHTLLHRPSPASAAGATLHRNASAATGVSPRLFHTQLHRPAGAIAGANTQMPAMMGASRGFSSHDKFTNQLEEEEAKMKKKKALAVALMNDIPKAGPGAADHGEEIGNINNLFGLLDVTDATTATSTATTNEADVALQLDELRILVEKRKNAMLIELLNDGDGRDQKKAELVDAARGLRAALAAHDERRAYATLYTDVKSLQQRVTAAGYNYKMLSDSVAAGRLELEAANANVNSIRADVRRLGVEVTSIKNGGSMSAKVKALEESLAKYGNKAEAAYNLSLFIGWSAVVAGTLTVFAIA